MWILARLLVTTIFVSVAATAFAQHPQDLLKEAWIKAEWSKAIRGERFERWDSWIPGLDGVGSAPIIRRDAAGRTWTIGEVCQPHNCADNKLFVIVDRSDRRVWGMQVTDSPAGRRYFGKPIEAAWQILRAAEAGDLSRFTMPSGAGQQNPTPQAISQGGSAQSGARGTIEGELSYPSDYIPRDMAICAEDIQSKQLLCNARKTRRGDAVRYTMSLPPGVYHVFARTADQPNYRAYYTEHVTCGSDARCKSHRRIAVTVSAGAKISRIDPQDWYDNP